MERDLARILTDFEARMAARKAKEAEEAREAVEERARILRDRKEGR